MSVEKILQDATDMAARSRDGYRSICGIIDLLGMKEMIMNDIVEAQRRIDALHTGFSGGCEIYPGLKGCRASFFGDSVSILKEIAPEECLEDEYENFAGNILAISSFLAKCEHELLRPGMRAVVSFGKLIPLSRPDAWRNSLIAEDTKEWHAFTGANEAFAKCHLVDDRGSKSGFEHGHIWVEKLDHPLTFAGVPFLDLPADLLLNENVNAHLYRQIVVEQSQRSVLLESTQWES